MDADRLPFILFNFFQLDRSQINGQRVILRRERSGGTDVGAKEAVTEHADLAMGVDGRSTAPSAFRQKEDGFSGTDFCALATM